MGYRLVYELSYLVEKIFLSIFAQQGWPLPKKKLKIFSQPDMTIRTKVDFPPNTDILNYGNDKLN
jgi:hypothetical protein